MSITSVNGVHQVVEWPYRKRPGVLLVTTHQAGDRIAAALAERHINAVCTPHLRVAWDFRETWADGLRNPLTKYFGDRPDKDHISDVKRTLCASDRLVVVFGPGWTHRLKFEPDARSDGRRDVAMYVVGVCHLAWLVDVPLGDHDGPPGIGKFAFSDDADSMAGVLLDRMVERLEGKLPAA